MTNNQQCRLKSERSSEMLYQTWYSNLKILCLLQQIFMYFDYQELQRKITHFKKSRQFKQIIKYRMFFSRKDKPLIRTESVSLKNRNHTI